MIDKDTIDRIKTAVDIVEVVEDFVVLKKTGQSYKGLSPFNEEKTPSFIVSPNKGIFKDFSSGKGGDAITFIMEHEGLSYVEALKYLAKKYGIEVEEKEQTPEQLAAQTERESLFIVLEFAANYYKDLLLNHDTGQAIGYSYFKERGLNDETIKKFDLGYSLESWDELVKEAQGKHFNIDILEKAGLVLRKEERVYDRFRGRAIFPIHNLTGKVIAFGARILTNDKKQPKYVNSPETPVYHKSDVLYGMHLAKNQIRNEDNCFLVEGYTDVISLHQGGITNVVASSGTALTENQIRLIGRYTKNVTVLYDGDAAGIRASTRGIDLILEQGMNVHAVVFPDGQDPDSYIKDIGATAFQEFLEKESTDFISFKTKLFLEDAGQDPIKRAEVIREIVTSISKVPDAIKRTVFFQQCSTLLGIDESVLIGEYNKVHLKERKQKRLRAELEQEETLQQGGPPTMPMEMPEVEEVSPETTLKDQEKEIMRLLLSYGDMEVEEGTYLAQYIIPEITDVEFSSPEYSQIVETYKSEMDKGQVPGSEYFLQSGKQQLINTVVDLIATKYEISENWEKYQIYVNTETDNLEKVAYSSILRLKWRNLRVMIKQHQELLTKTDDPGEIEELQRKFLRFKEMEMTIAKLLGNVTIR